MGLTGSHHMPLACASSLTGQPLPVPWLGGADQATCTRGQDILGPHFVALPKPREPSECYSEGRGCVEPFSSPLPSRGHTPSLLQRALRNCTKWCPSPGPKAQFHDTTFLGTHQAAAGSVTTCLLLLICIIYNTVPGRW